MRTRGRVDDNQVEIVGVLRGHGATVVSLANVGAGVPDLLIGYGGISYLAEVKDGRKAPSRRTLTEDQAYFVETWQGGTIAIFSSAEQADRWMRNVKGRRR